jgi:inhibitor of the pro-sigma K processing machinery
VEATTAFWYVAGLFALLLVLRVLAKPLAVLLRVAGSSIAGGLGLWVINQAGRPFGFHLALNPASAAIAGMLGIPGVVALGMIRLILG